MKLSPLEFDILLAALRLTSTSHEALANQALAAGDRQKAMRLSAFAYKCGELSDKLDQSAKTGGILRPN
jgi:hypothetical protein